MVNTTSFDRVLKEEKKKKIQCHVSPNLVYTIMGAEPASVLHYYANGVYQSGSVKQNGSASRDIVLIILCRITGSQQLIWSLFHKNSKVDMISLVSGISRLVV